MIIHFWSVIILLAILDEIQCTLRNIQYILPSLTTVTITSVLDTYYSAISCHYTCIEASHCRHLPPSSHYFDKPSLTVLLFLLMWRIFHDDSFVFFQGLVSPGESLSLQVPGGNTDMTYCWSCLQWSAVMQATVKTKLYWTPHPSLSRVPCLLFNEKLQSSLEMAASFVIEVI